MEFSDITVGSQITTTILNTSQKFVCVEVIDEMRYPISEEGENDPKKRRRSLGYTPDGTIQFISAEEEGKTGEEIEKMALFAGLTVPGSSYTVKEEDLASIQFIPEDDPEFDKQIKTQACVQNKILDVMIKNEEEFDGPLEFIDLIKKQVSFTEEEQELFEEMLPHLTEAISPGEDLNQLIEDIEED